METSPAAAGDGGSWSGAPEDATRARTVKRIVRGPRAAPVRLISSTSLLETISADSLTHVSSFLTCVNLRRLACASKTMGRVMKTSATPLAPRRHTCRTMLGIPAPLSSAAASRLLAGLCFCPSVLRMVVRPASGVTDFDNVTPAQEDAIMNQCVDVIRSVRRSPHALLAHVAEGLLTCTCPSEEEQAARKQEEEEAAAAVDDHSDAADAMDAVPAPADAAPAPPAAEARPAAAPQLFAMGMHGGVQHAALGAAMMAAMVAALGQHAAGMQQHAAAPAAAAASASSTPPASTAAARSRSASVAPTGSGVGSNTVDSFDPRELQQCGCLRNTLTTIDVELLQRFTTSKREMFADFTAWTEWLESDQVLNAAVQDPSPVFGWRGALLRLALHAGWPPQSVRKSSRRWPAACLLLEYRNNHTWLMTDSAVSKEQWANEASHAAGLAITTGPADATLVARLCKAADAAPVYARAAHALLSHSNLPLVATFVQMVLKHDAWDDASVHRRVAHAAIVHRAAKHHDSDSVKRIAAALTGDGTKDMMSTVASWLLSSTMPVETVTHSIAGLLIQIVAASDRKWRSLINVASAMADMCMFLVTHNAPRCTALVTRTHALYKRIPSRQCLDAALGLAFLMKHWGEEEDHRDAVRKLLGNRAAMVDGPAADAIAAAKAIATRRRRDAAVAEAMAQEEEEGEGDGDDVFGVPNALAHLLHMLGGGPGDGAPGGLDGLQFFPLL